MSIEKSSDLGWQFKEQTLPQMLPLNLTENKLQNLSLSGYIEGETLQNSKEKYGSHLPTEDLRREYSQTLKVKKSKLKSFDITTLISEMEKSLVTEMNRALWTEPSKSSTQLPMSLRDKQAEESKKF